MSAPNSVLLVEDDPIIARTLSLSLRHHGFRLVVTPTVRDALQELSRNAFAIALLDVGLPDGSGVELCRMVRRRDERIPILMVTARTDEPTAVASIEGGADDYIRKPFGLNELVARMNRLLARTQSARTLFTFGSLTLDPQRRTATVGATPLSLGKREFDILATLVRAHGDTVTRDQLLTAMGHDDKIYDRTIDSHLSHVRSKLKSAGAGAAIVAVYGVGYRLEMP